MNLGNNVKLDYPSTTIRLGLAPDISAEILFHNHMLIRTRTFKSIIPEIGRTHNFLIDLGIPTRAVLGILREFKPYRGSSYLIIK